MSEKYDMMFVVGKLLWDNKLLQENNNIIKLRGRNYHTTMSLIIIDQRSYNRTFDLLKDVCII